MRPIQAQTHRQIADCYSNKTASAHEVEHCANNCTVPLKNIQNVVQNEMNQFQEKLTRCTMVCQDQVGEKFNLNGNLSDRDRDAAQKLMGSCVNGCVEKHISLLKSIQSNIEKEVTVILNRK